MPRKVCDDLGLQPAAFYRWQKEFFENGVAASKQKARPNHSAGQRRRIACLEKKSQTKDEVLRSRYRKLIVPKRLHGINLRGAAGGNIAGEKRHGDQKR